MMRHLGTCALTSAVLTFVTAVALRAGDAATAVAAVAATAVLLTWYAQLGSTEEESALDLVNPASAATLSVVRRRSWATFLPTLAAHAVGAAVAGVAAGGLDTRLAAPLVYDADDLVVGAVAAALVGLVGAWATLAVDGGGHAALTAVPVVVAGSFPLALVAAFSPTVVLGLATAELLPWDVAAVVAAVGLAAAALGAWAVSALVPTEQS